MLERDKYIQDSTFKYHPDFSMPSFLYTYTGMNPTIGPYLPENVSSIKKNNQINMYGSSALFFSGILAAIFYKRIPWIRNFTSKKARVLWSSFFIFIPSGIFAGVWNSLSQVDIQMKFARNSQNFALYKATRDITKLNPDVRMVDD